MSSKTISVWLSQEDHARYKAAADARGVSLSTFLKSCADQALTPADPRADFRRLGADIRADLGQTINRLAETHAIASQSRDTAVADIRDMLNGFLKVLADQQVNAVLGALKAGQGKPATARPTTRDPTPAELGLPPSPPPLS